MRTSACPADLFQPLEDALRRVFLPSLTGQPTLSGQTRDLLALPARLGGVGIINLTNQRLTQLGASERFCQPLVQLNLQQDGSVWKHEAAKLGFAGTSPRRCASFQRQHKQLLYHTFPLRSSAPEWRNTKRCFCMGHCPPTRSAWLFTSQGCLSRRIVSTVWMAPTAHAGEMRMWLVFLCGSRCHLPVWRMHHN